MLYSLVDGRARTTTELAATANVTAATASVHLQRLKMQQLVTVFEQGSIVRHARRKRGRDRARIAERACGRSRRRLQLSHAPSSQACTNLLRPSRGNAGGLLHDRLVDGQSIDGSADGDYDVTAAGAKNSAGIGIDGDASAVCAGASRSHASTGASGDRTSGEPLCRIAHGLVQAPLG